MAYDLFVCEFGGVGDGIECACAFVGVDVCTFTGAGASVNRGGCKRLKVGVSISSTKVVSHTKNAFFN